MIELIRQLPSPLDRLHRWRPGDKLTHLDGRPIEDILDLYYYTPAGRNTLLSLERDDGTTTTLEIDPADIGALTSCFAPLEFKTCACKCVFCFVDQNPPGMRDQIYVKDEDYRFSFLYGNYITLTSLGRRGLQRIIDQGMSPLYVSVHATDIDVRTRMLGIRKKIDILEIMARLKEAEIEIHAQVVLCPGWNDGPILEQTFRDLLSLAPGFPGSSAPFQPVNSRGHGRPRFPEDQPAEARGGVRSLAVVPVGLSAHREGLTRLDPVSEVSAAEVVAQVAHWQEEAAAGIGHRFIYLSDEFFLLAGQAFPPVEHYDGFWQVDSAIGLTPRLRDLWEQDLSWAASHDGVPRKPLTVLTGELAAKAWRREFLPVLRHWGCPEVEVLGVPNTFFGNTVTVAGLLSGHDLRAALQALQVDPSRTVVLSPRVFNSDGLTLDDMTLEDITKGLSHRVAVGEEDEFIAFWRELD